MIPYLTYYLFSLSLLLVDKKYIPFFFSLGWFLFVGFRDGIGTDYFPVMESFERNYIDFQNFGASFKGYMLVDMELVFKIIATPFYYLGIDMIGIHVVTSFIESILIYFLLKKIKHKKLLMLYFVALFTLNYPMNITRNGLALLLLVFAANYFRDEKGKKKLFTLFSALSHYSSIPLILLTTIRIKKVSTIIVGASIMFLIFYFFLDMLALRYPIGQSGAMGFKGYGFKLILGTILMLMINYFVVERRFFKQENVIIIALMFGAYLFNPLARYNLFYTTFILFSNLFIIDDRKIGPNSRLMLLSMPLLMLFGEWLAIISYVQCYGCGSWLPFKSLLGDF